MEMQNIHDNQNNLEKKKKWRLLPDLKTCCKATVNKTMYHEDRKASLLLKCLLGQAETMRNRDEL